MEKELTFNLSDAIFVKFYKSEGIEDELQIEVCVIPSDSIMFSAIASVDKQKIENIKRILEEIKKELVDNGVQH